MEKFSIIAIDDRAAVHCDECHRLHRQDYHFIDSLSELLAWLREHELTVHPLDDTTPLEVLAEDATATAPGATRCRAYSAIFGYCVAADGHSRETHLNVFGHEWPQPALNIQACTLEQEGIETVDGRRVCCGQQYPDSHTPTCPERNCPEHGSYGPPPSDSWDKYHYPRTVVALANVASMTDWRELRRAREDRP